MCGEKEKQRQRCELWNEMLQHLLPQPTNKERCEKRNQTMTVVGSDTEQKEVYSA